MFATMCMKPPQPQALQVGCLHGMSAVTWAAVGDVYLLAGPEETGIAEKYGQGDG